MSNNCNHYYSNGEPAISFVKNRWRGVYPKKFDGVCKICKAQVSMSESEYKDYMKEGEDFETDF